MPERLDHEQIISDYGRDALLREADLEQISFNLSRISLNPLLAKLEAEQM
jgi:hypothetical protein